MNEAVYYGVNGVLILMTFNERDGPRASYTVSADPEPNSVMSNGSRHKLLLAYDTSYRVTITATLCGQYTSITEVVMVYGE